MFNEWFKPLTRLPAVGHMPLTTVDALRQMLTMRKVNRRVRDGYYADHLVFVTGMEKAATKMVGACIGVLQHHLGPSRRKEGSTYGRRVNPAYVSPHYDVQTLRPELVLHLPDGGVVKRHFCANIESLGVLEWLGSKYVIMVRHPADHMAGMYAHLSEKIGRWANYPAHPIPFSVCDKSVTPDQFIDTLINEGHLFTVLKWVADWLYARDQDNSKVMRYEDFVTQPREFYNSLSHFLYNKDVSEAAVEECLNTSNGYHNAAERFGEERRYTGGYTGSIGIWKNYFSEKNKRDYTLQVNSFLNSYPLAKGILDLYPDIGTLDDGV